IHLLQVRDDRPRSRDCPWRLSTTIRFKRLNVEVPIHTCLSGLLLKEEGWTMCNGHGLSEKLISFFFSSLNQQTLHGREPLHLGLQRHRQFIIGKPRDHKFTGTDIYCSQPRLCPTTGYRYQVVILAYRQQIRLRERTS